MCFEGVMICEHEWLSKTVDFFWWSKEDVPTYTFLQVCFLILELCVYMCVVQVNLQVYAVWACSMSMQYVYVGSYKLSCTFLNLGWWNNFSSPIWHICQSYTLMYLYGCWLMVDLRSLWPQLLHPFQGIAASWNAPCARKSFGVRKWYYCVSVFLVLMVLWRKVVFRSLPHWCLSWKIAVYTGSWGIGTYFWVVFTNPNFNLLDLDGWRKVSIYLITLSNLGFDPGTFEESWGLPARLALALLM